MWKLNDFLDTTLTPTDEQMGSLATADWWTYVKPFFDDEIWQYYNERIVFLKPKFPEDNYITTKQNIIRSFVINLKTKARQYERLYGVIMEDYNPLWNVDGVTGVVAEDTHTGTDTRAKSGYDTSALSGTDRSVLSGSDVDRLSGSDVGTLSGQDIVVGSVDSTKDYNISKDDHTKTGNETIASTGNDVNEKKTATFDSQGNYLPTEQDTLQHGKVDTHTYNSVKDAHELSSEETLDQDSSNTTSYGKVDTTSYGKVDTMTYGKQDATTYGKQDRTTYNSQEQDTKALTDKHVEMEIRHGNIGVTSSQSLLDQELSIWLDSRADFIKLVVRECVNVCTYAIEGV